ncbi:fungal specific transcription factor domain-containing protein [Colletotrichum truncatum]|uniref:Fungal specific transcription factor domain-containing protein n=1 Tax=Colletotrichum truncatum TaxID=5467 RepID=A0ACC3YP15_COLTU|nr:fungal specific transcription factor domain-containing protein [Colletotrichum truncatum]KAF6782789.1 fungal specific transcription factor domain-containing protein [Colletotrichum truncatum]
MENDALPVTATRKRKRNPIACSSCRARKSRCDGARPSCSACIEQTITCVYAVNSGANTALVPKQYLEHVENRLADVEEAISRLKEFIPTAVLEDRQHVIYSHGVSSRRNHPSESSFTENSLHAEEGSTHIVSPDATDGVGTIEFTNDGTWTYFGPTSNIAFTRNIRRTLNHLQRTSSRKVRHPEVRPPREAQQHNLAVSRSHSPIDDSFDSRRLETPSEACHLPPNVEVSRLIRQFFSDTGLLFPYVHEESFLKAYVQFQSIGMNNARRSWLALLNMILAMATSTTSTKKLGLSHRQAISETYYQRAKALSMGQMMCRASVEAVQVMLLMSLYLQGSQRSVQTWAIHGLAVKAAMELGLHSEISLQRFDPLERETRIRTWYGCIVLDRTLSMTFGRPPIIPQSYVRTNLPSHSFHQLSGVGELRWSGEEESTLFWNKSIALYGVTAAVIDELYENNIGSGTTIPIANVLSTVIHISQRLATWQTSLPTSMQLVDRSEILEVVDNPLSLKFRVILTLRYHNLHILSHRPILDRCLQIIHEHPHTDQGSAPLKQGWYFSKEACLQSAESIIRLVEACKVSIDANPAVSFLGAWWFSLYFTFNAALVVIAIKLIDESLSPLSPEPACANASSRVDDILRNAVTCISRLDRQNPMVEKCSNFVAALIFLVQSLSVPEKASGCPMTVPSDFTSTNIEPSSSGVQNDTGDEFSSLMDFLPPNLYTISGVDAPFAVSELMNDFVTEDLFW